jgi:putative OPT family oligopeptide transporter
MSNDFKPYVPNDKIIPEFTFQAVGLGLILSIIMCAANVYVGLYAGMTVSAAIPASVISMGILRGLLKRGTILENNIVHTMASSGESLAAGIIFTIPAIVLLGIWTDFNYWETTLIAMAGGILGVVMMIPLRKPMIIEQKELRFPEGVACAEVLKAGDKGGAEMMGIFSALGIGALFKILASNVVGIFRGSVEGAFKIGKTAWYVGSDISPMLTAVGFIVGWEISLLVFMGGAISYFVAIPIISSGVEIASSEVLDSVWGIWDSQIRFFGIGAMIVAGVVSIFKIAGSMGAALKTAFSGIRGKEDTSSLPRTEQGITGKTLFTLMILSLLLGCFVYAIMTKSAATTAITGIAMFILAFFFVAVASYIVGLVGSSNSPVSGMTICTVLLTAGLLLLLGYTGVNGMLATLGVAGVVCCAACTAGDICQDLKIGHIVGATPKKLQVGELIGVMIPAFIIAPVMQLLNNAYGIGKPAREGVEALKAPQGVMFEKLVGGIFGAGKDIPWDLVFWGAGVGIVAILIDYIILQPRNTKFRLHSMPLAVGMYLPLTVTFPILIGGFIYKLIDKVSTKRGDTEEEKKSVIHRGLLFSSGLVAGEAIMGIIIAVLVIFSFKISFLAGWTEKGGRLVDIVSILGLIVILAILYKKSMKKTA